MYKHLTKLSLAGVVALAQLTGDIVFQAQLIGRAVAQITRCPCYNEMAIVGVCGLDPTCIKKDRPAEWNVLSCPSELGAPPNWNFISSTSAPHSWCVVSGKEGTFRFVTEEEGVICRQAIESAAAIMGCETP